MPAPTWIEVHARGTAEDAAFGAWLTEAKIGYKLDTALRMYAGMEGAPDHPPIVTLQALHYLWVQWVASGGKGVAGPVTSATAGAVSMTVGINAVAAGSLLRSPFGAELEDLLTANSTGPSTGMGPKPRFRGM